MDSCIIQRDNRAQKRPHMRDSILYKRLVKLASRERSFHLVPPEEPFHAESCHNRDPFPCRNDNLTTALVLRVEQA